MGDLLEDWVANTARFAVVRSSFPLVLPLLRAAFHLLRRAVTALAAQRTMGAACRSALTDPGDPAEEANERLSVMLGAEHEVEGVTGYHHEARVPLARRRHN